LVLPCGIEFTRTLNFWLIDWCGWMSRGVQTNELVAAL
jgi:hypothetical protein